jgi:peptide/nickel transport system substrate-binding protein
MAQANRYSPIRSAVSALIAGLLMTAPAAGRAESVVTVGMTAGDIPATTGNPDQGFEGFRFVGYNLYDGLALWDLSQRLVAIP